MVFGIFSGTRKRLVQGQFASVGFDIRYRNFKTPLSYFRPLSREPFQCSVATDSGKSHQIDRSPRTTSCIDYWPLYIGDLGAGCKTSCSSYKDRRGAPLLANCIPE